MDTWDIQLVNRRGDEKKKCQEDYLTVACLRITRKTHPEAWADLVRMVLEAAE